MLAKRLPIEALSSDPMTTTMSALMGLQEQGFELVRDMILSGQIQDQDVPGLLREFPQFALWYQSGILASIHR